MGTGYTRNDTSNNIADGNIINAADLDGEFDAIESAMGTSGHTHDGTSAEGGPVTVLGPVQDFVASATEIKPKTTNTLDIGTSGLLFKDMFLDGVATIGSIKIDNAGTIGSASDSDAIAISSGGVVSFSQNTIGKTGSGYVLSLQTSDTTIEATNVLGKIEFSAPDEASGTDAILVGASIEALAEDTFDSATNSTALVFKTNTTGAATERMRLTSAGDLHFLDNRKAIFGAGSDLQIYHDGSNSYIHDNGIGSLKIRADQLRIESADGSETLAVFNQNSDVFLRHDNTTRLATTSTGIDVTGTVTADALNVSAASPNIDVTDTGTSHASQDFLTNSNAVRATIGVERSAGGGLFVGSSPYAAVFGTASSGATEFATNNNVRMTISSTGSVGIGTSSPSYPLHVSGTGDKVMAVTAGASSIAALNLGNSTNLADGGIRYDNSADALILRASNAEKMRITSAGNVGIGTSSPSANLEITQSGNNVGLLVAGGGYNYTAKFESSDAEANIIIEDSNSTNNGNMIGVATDDMYFLTGGSERMRIDSSGNVGIGTDSPNDKVDISGSTGDGYRLTDGTHTGVFRSISGGTILKTTTNHALMLGTNDSERMRIDSSGNVGIGASSPSSFSGSRLVVKPSVGEAGTNDVQSWEYTSFSSGSEYDLRLQQVVSSGLVKHQFNVRNGGTDYTSNLVLDRGNVGIGTSSPSELIELSAATDPRIRINNSSDTLSANTVIGGLEFYTNDASAGGTGIGASIDAYAQSNFGSNQQGLYLTFSTRDSGSGETNTERMRIDSSGNLLVGATSAVGLGNGTNEGISISSSQKQIVVGTDSDVSLYLNRQTSDGDIAVFRKDGSTVGSIGVEGSDLTIGTGDTGLQFRDASDAIRPFNLSTNSVRDASIDLGRSTGPERFRNLYLSGGVYLGGTGSANHLDDYEEGTWTPTVDAFTTSPTVGYDAQRGTYTKVGRLVTVHFYVDTNSRSGGSGSFIIGGIPFAISSDNQALGAVQAEYKGISMPSDANNIFIRINPSNSFFNLEFMDTRASQTVANRGNIQIGSVGADARVLATVTYITDA